LLRDAIGLHVEADGARSDADRAEIAARGLADWRGGRAMTAGAVDRMRAARELLPRVTMRSTHRRRACEIAAEMAVEGHRAEIFAMRAARAHAAYCGRASVSADDLDAVVPLTLRWRQRETAERRAPAGARVGQTPNAGAGQDGRPGEGTPEQAQPIDNPAPSMMLPGPGAAESAGRGRAECGSGRGRYVRAVDYDPGHGAIALDATLRAAVPFQRMRRAAGGRIAILGQDLRYKQFRRKAGIEIVVALDASGSMAANRVREAKGAVLRLLRESYIHRHAARAGDPADRRPAERLERRWTRVAGSGTGVRARAGIEGQVAGCGHGPRGRRVRRRPESGCNAGRRLDSAAARPGRRRLFIRAIGGRE
jgi:magnesium chelatase subunit D